MSLAERVAALLGPDGVLARRWPRFEARASQREMAVEAARTLEQGGVLMAEAPTGVGKSLAYLLPLSLYVRERGARAVVATATRALQDQLFERDLPALMGALDVPMRVARLKGKANYLCPRLLEGLAAHGEDERELADELRAWAASTATGDLDGFETTDAEGFRRLRPRVAADPLACAGNVCRRGAECFWVRARRRAAEAQILIVNHALLGLSSQAEGLLPDHEVLVVDEAHRLEGMLLSQLECSVSRHRFEEGIEALGGPRSTRGLLARARREGLPLFGAGGRRAELAESLARRAAPAREDVAAFFAAAAPRAESTSPYGVRERYRSAEELLGRELEPLERVLAHSQAYGRDLAALAREAAGPGVGGDAESLAAELEQRAAQWSILARDLADLGMAADRERVYWRTAGRRGVELRGSPVTLARATSAALFGRPRATVLTSATLRAGEDFEFAASRLGLDGESGFETREVAVSSPFDLARQLRVYVFGSGGSEAETVSDAVAALAKAAPRNLLVLLTAHERLRAVRERLHGKLPAGTLLLAQEWDGSAARVSDRFRRARGAVLLGVQSLWEGVDFPGEELEVLVMAKLPFSVPDEPLVQARGERLRERGLDPFRADAVPEAVLRFRQGLGRLIRRADDRGVAVVCDPRLLTAGYRRPFLESLPVVPERVESATDLAERAARFLSAAAAPAEPA